MDEATLGPPRLPFALGGAESLNPETPLPLSAEAGASDRRLAKQCSRPRLPRELLGAALLLGLTALLALVQGGLEDGAPRIRSAHAQACPPYCACRHRDQFSRCCIVQRVLTVASRLDVMNRLGRAMADPTRSRILMTLLEGPSYPAVLARDLGLTRSNVSNHLTCLRDCGIVVAEPEGRQTRYEIADPHLGAAMTALVEVTLAVDENAPCVDATCTVPGCCPSGTVA